ncbi:MAG: hypothetical protein M8467_00945 [Anaerolineae bacterium]|nr:hypothetical protein [Anaerolineae bacterium]
MHYPDWRLSETIIKAHLAETQAVTASNSLPRHARPISAGRLRLLTRVSRGLLSLGRRVTEAGLALQIPDVPQPSH